MPALFWMPPAAMAQSAVMRAEPQTLMASLAIEFDMTSQPVRVTAELPWNCAAWEAVLLSARMQASAAVWLIATERARSTTGEELK